MALDPPPAFDVPAMVRSLDTGLELDWLATSCAWPERFHEALAAHIARTSSAPVKSRPQTGYDLYHDVVVRHVGHGRAAFAWHDVAAGWTALTFDELHQRCGALEHEWSAAGVTAGSKVALVLPTDRALVVALLTALRMGAVPCVLPPRGATFLLNRLAQLAPDAVATHPRYATLLGSWAARAVPPEPSSAWLTSVSTVRSFTGPAGTPALLACSPLGASPARPLAVTADQCFAGMLRDAVLVLGLSPADRVAIPGFDVLQHQPCMLLATLFAGACFVEASEELLAREPPRRELAPTVVGVTDALRDKAVRRELSTERWRLWFSNAAMPWEWSAWDQLARLLADQPRCRGMLLIASAAYGGSLLLSTRKPNRSPLAVLPAPGQPWQLMDIAMTDQPAQGDVGTYAGAASQADPDAWGRFLLSKGGGELVFGGSTHVGFLGQSYPSDEVLRLVESQLDIDAASVVILPAQGMNTTRLTLLIFAARDPVDAGRLARLEQEAAALIARELGPGYAPPQVRAFPLVPRRRADGTTDHDWCRWQFQSGGLDRKVREPIFLTAHGLRRALAHMAREHGAALTSTPSTADGGGRRPS